MSHKQPTTTAVNHAEQNMLWRGEGIRHMVEQVAVMDGFDELSDTGYRCRVEVNKDLQERGK